MKYFAKKREMKKNIETNTYLKKLAKDNTKTDIQTKTVLLEEKKLNK